MHKRLTRSLITPFVLCLGPGLMGQGIITDSTDNRSIQTETRIPGARYRARGLHRFCFGAHYRDLWTTPLEIPYLDLDTYAGGLTVIKKGGGQQTKSLRFGAPDGRQFAFRSLDKDPSKTLPAELRETIAASVLQDQISSAHPYAALVVPPLAEAVGVLHATPELAIMPDDEKLGKFRDEFAGLVGMIEERPVDGPRGTPGFAGSKKIVSTDDLFEELAKDNDDYVEPRAFLKARLLDIYLGDWDRHADQWRWARFERGSKKVWYPIPRDRDQTFAKFDGLLPSLAEKRYVVRQFEGFNKCEPDIISLTHSGRHLDRRFLNRLTYEDFQSVQEEFVAALTDPVIDRAVRQLPPPAYELSGEALVKKLKERRLLMEKAAYDFYRHLAKYVEIKTSDKDEYAEVVRLDNERVAVRIFKRDKETGEKKQDSLFERTFKRGETKEVRLFLAGGRDKVVVSGTVDNSILVRIIGGSGEDEIIDHSKVNGYFLSVIPFLPAAEHKTYIYDTKAGTKIVAGPSSVLKTGDVDSVVNFHEDKPALRDYGFDTKPLPFLAITADDGLFLGGGPIIYHYKFRKQPYAYKMTVVGNYAFKTGAFRVRYQGDFVDFFHGARLGLIAQATVPREVRNFYGFGNDSQRDAELEQDDFYRVRSEEYVLQPSIHLNPLPKTAVSLGGAFQRFETDFGNADSTFASQARPYGVAVASLLQFNAGLEIDLRDRAAATTKGFYLGMGVSHYPKVLENDSAFTKMHIDSRIFLSPHPDVTFGLWATGEKIWGSFPYYEAAYIGGIRSLRGFRRERFGGEAALHGSAEVRFRLFRLDFIVPTHLGLFVFGDAGKVWVSGDESLDLNDLMRLRGFHTDSGAGLWFAPIYRTMIFSIGIASSVEGIRLSARGGFMF